MIFPFQTIPFLGIHVNFPAGNLWHSPVFCIKPQTALVIRFDHSQDAWVEWVDPSKTEGKLIIFQSHPNFAGVFGRYVLVLVGGISWENLREVILEKKTYPSELLLLRSPSLGKKDPKYQGRQSPTRTIPTSSRACEICLQQRVLTTAGWEWDGRDGRLKLPFSGKKNENQTLSLSNFRR